MEGTSADQAILIREDVLALGHLTGVPQTGTVHETLRQIISAVEVLKARQPGPTELALEQMESPDRRWDLLQMLRRLGLRTQEGRVGMMPSVTMECSHWLLYASQHAMELRTMVNKRGDLDWAAFLVGMDEILNILEALRNFVAGKGVAPLHKNELAGAGAPPPGVIMAEQAARRMEP